MTQNPLKKAGEKPIQPPPLPSCQGRVQSWKILTQGAFSTEKGGKTGKKSTETLDLGIKILPEFGGLRRFFTHLGKRGIKGKWIQRKKGKGRSKKNWEKGEKKQGKVKKNRKGEKNKKKGKKNPRESSKKNPEKGKKLRGCSIRGKLKG